MAKDSSNRIKDAETYESLREDGASKDDLYERAQELGIESRSDMDKDKLIDALHNH